MSIPSLQRDSHPLLLRIAYLAYGTVSRDNTLTAFVSTSNNVASVDANNVLSKIGWQVLKPWSSWCGKIDISYMSKDEITARGNGNLHVELLGLDRPA